MKIEASVRKLVKFARKSPREQSQAVRDRIRHLLVEGGWKVPCVRNDRTAYIIGLLGTGRSYVAQLIVQNIGERAEYLREYIRFHPGPTSMIYVSHATLRYVSRGQMLPQVTSRLLESVRSGFADLIFILRHPLDSLLTNWVWWRTLNRENRTISGITQVYRDRDDFCADLDRNFLEFKAFAEASPLFWAGVPGRRFLSLPQFVEETNLYLQSATLTLRLEDFAMDPLKEFSKIVRVMSADLDLSRLRLEPPRTKPYGYLVVKEKVPRFRDFINALDAQTRRGIAESGYDEGLD
jgi:hypothetical protein